MVKRKGFTLIELLVVIAIIALLMSILMPALAKVRTQAQTVTCKARMKQWALAISMYVNSNNSYFWTGATGWGHEWIKAMEPYFVPEKGINFCPVATKLPTQGATGGKFRAAWVMPAGYPGIRPVNERLTTDTYGSYGLSDWVDNPTPGAGIFGDGRYWKTINIKNAGNVPVLLDSDTTACWPDSVSEPPEYEGQVRGIPDLSAQMFDFCFSRHGGGVTNCLFVDLSVRTGGLKKLWKLQWNQKSETNGPQPVWPTWMTNSAMNRDF